MMVPGAQSGSDPSERQLYIIKKKDRSETTEKVDKAKKPKR